LDPDRYGSEPVRELHHDADDVLLVGVRLGTNRVENPREMHIAVPDVGNIPAEEYSTRCWYNEVSQRTHLSSMIVARRRAGIKRRPSCFVRRHPARYAKGPGSKPALF